MNSTYDILLLGPAGPAPEAARRYDLAVVDLRAAGASGPGPDVGALDPALPLLAVASEPGPALRALTGRLSMVLTGAERPSGYQVALAVCAALGRCRVPAAGSPVA